MSNPGTSKDLGGINDVTIDNLVEKKFFAIVSLAATDVLRHEYQIFFGEHMFKCINFKEGNDVKVKYGDGTRMGTIVKLSTNELYLKDNFDEFIRNFEEWVRQRNEEIPIGSKGTRVTKGVYDSIDWSTYSTATTGLLKAFFSREVLATHSLTRSRCSTSRTGKYILDPNIISDMVEMITTKYNVSKVMVKTIISKRCYNEKRGK